MFELFKKKCREPVIGEIWPLVNKDKSPWPDKPTKTFASIIDVKDKWVRYGYVLDDASVSNDVREEIHWFVRIFNPPKEKPQDGVDT